MGTMEWLTAGLAVATTWLAWTTREMAKATKQLAELEARPYLSLAAVELESGVVTGPQYQNPFVNARLRLANPGKVLIQYRIATIDIEIHGQRLPASTPLLNRGGSIHPGMNTLFMLPSIQLPHDTPSPVQGKIELSVRFFAISQEERSMNATIQLEIHLKPKLDYRWYYTSGPVYA